MCECEWYFSTFLSCVSDLVTKLSYSDSEQKIKSNQVGEKSNQVGEERYRKKQWILYLLSTLVQGEWRVV